MAAGEGSETSSSNIAQGSDAPIGEKIEPAVDAHTGAELDLLMMKHGKRVGVEFKRMDAPRLTPSMRNAMSDLKLDALYVVYSGKRRYNLADRTEAVPLESFIAPR